MKETWVQSLKLGRSPGEGNGYPLQYSGLENPTDYSPWGCKESDTTERLSLFQQEAIRHKPKMGGIPNNRQQKITPGTFQILQKSVDVKDYPVTDDANKNHLSSAIYDLNSKSF